MAVNLFLAPFPFSLLSSLPSSLPPSLPHSLPPSLTSSLPHFLPPSLPPCLPHSLPHSISSSSHFLTFASFSCRFLRHVPVIYVDYPGGASLRQIYGTFNRAMLRLVPNLRAYADPLTEAMVEFYTLSQVHIHCTCTYGQFRENVNQGVKISKWVWCILKYTILKLNK